MTISTRAEAGEDAAVLRLLRACGHNGVLYSRALALICRQEMELARVKDLLEHASEYVADSLEAHEHSDGRDLLNSIAIALATGEADGTE